jgi:hypothetical protein
VRPAIVNTLPRIGIILLGCFLIWLVFTAGVCEMVPMSEPILPGDLFGGYRATISAGHLDSLYLLPDSLYVRRYESWDGRAFTDTGVWTTVPLDSISGSHQLLIQFPEFVSRYNVDSAGKGAPFGGVVGIPDSVPARRDVVVWKYSHGSFIYFRLGSPYGAAWVKTVKRK